MKNLLYSQIKRGRWQARVAILCFLDVLFLCVAYVLAFALRINTTTPLLEDLLQHKSILLIALLLGPPILLLTNTFRELTRYATSRSLLRFAIRSTLMILVVSQVSRFARPQQSVSFWFLFWGLFIVLGVTSRVVLKEILQNQTKASQNLPVNISASPTLIYGAGNFGFKLYEELRNDSKYQIIGYLDSDKSLQARTVQGLPIYDPSNLESLIQSRGVEVILLAMPKLSRHRKWEIVKKLTSMHLKVLSIPSISQLANGKVHVNDIKMIEIEDILGRDPASPMESLLDCCVKSMNVLVIGAGGSIGSEICRKLVELEATKIVMLDHNEESLYNIDLDLRIAINEIPQNKKRPLIIPVLGSACESNLLEGVIKTQEIDTIYHAAAYKHVPLLEQNVCSGFANNMKATRSIVKAAISGKVRWLSLLSSDKAVRPPNVMGASKRVCELIVQAAAAEMPDDGPKLSIVRFGNVLGTSGSVVPLFHRLILKGGPVTVTDPAITRYFMTRQEAVELVLQSSALANGGDLFLLDMGEEVKVAEMARQMIQLSGLTVRDSDNPEGDIEIVYTGLRAGEKLYEELFLSGAPESTIHPLIWRVNEPFLNADQLNPILDELEVATSKLDLKRVLELITILVPEYVGLNKSL